MDEKEAKKERNYKREIYICAVFSLLMIFCILGWQVMAAALPELQKWWFLGFPIQYSLMLILSVPGLLVVWLIYAKYANENDEEREALEGSEK